MSWPLRDVEAVVDTLVTIVIPHDLPGRLQAIESQIGDGIALPMPVTILGHEPSIEEHPERPLIFVMPGDTFINADTGGFGDHGFADTTVEAAIYMIISMQDPAVGTKQRMRYRRAVMEIVGMNRANVNDRWGNAAWGGLSVQRTVTGSRDTPNDPDQNLLSYEDFFGVVVRATRTEA